MKCPVSTYIHVHNAAHMLPGEGGLPMRVMLVHMHIHTYMYTMQLAGVLHPSPEEGGLPMGLMLIGIGGEKEEGGGSWVCVPAK